METEFQQLGILSNVVRFISFNSKLTIKSLKMAEKLKGIKEKGCDVRSNYSGNLYSGMHKFVSQKEEKV
jgi:hypothetical protein